MKYILRRAFEGLLGTLIILGVCHLIFIISGLIFCLFTQDNCFDFIMTGFSCIYRQPANGGLVFNLLGFSFWYALGLMITSDFNLKNSKKWK